MKKIILAGVLSMLMPFAAYANGHDDLEGDETLSEFLADPRKALKGTKMSFRGLKKEDDLENVIAYLAQFDEEGNMAE